MLQIYVMRKSGDLGAAFVQIADLGCALLVRRSTGRRFHRLASYPAYPAYRDLPATDPP